MAEGDNALSNFIFWGNDPNVNQNLRQRIAMQMMQSRKAYPKTIGEGLTAVGDAIGEIGMAKRLTDADAAQNVAAREIAGKLNGAVPAPAQTSEAPPPVQTSDAPPVENTPPVAVAQRGDTAAAPEVHTSVAGDAPVPSTPDVFSTGAPPVQFAAAPSMVRDRIASLVTSRPGGPQANPTLAGEESPPSSSATDFSAQRRPDPGGPSAEVALSQTTPATAPARTLPGIKVAPPGQITGINPPGLTAGYVPPEMPTPPAPPVVPMSQQQRAILNAITQNPNNPYVAQYLKPKFDELEAARSYEQSRRLEQYKSDLIAAREREAKRQEMLGSSVKRNLDAEKLRQEIEQGKRPKLEEIKGKYIFDPEAGGYREAKVVGADPNAPPSVDLTEAQSKMLTFHDWARSGNTGVTGNDQLLAHGLQQELLGKIPFVGNKLQQAEYRRARSAANNFVLAFMRDTSGAAYGAKEMYDHAQAFLPAYGDDAQTLADKAKRRQQFTDSLYAGMGQDARKAADWAGKQSSPTATDIEMQGVPKIDGEIRTNKKTGTKRVWSDKTGHWMEVK